MRTAKPGPFSVNVRDLVNRPGEMREVDLETDLSERWGEGLVAIQPDERVEVHARLESVHEGILVTAEVDTEYRGICGRCLIDIHAPVEVEFQELFAYPGSEANDFEVQDNHVDLETLVRDAIVLSLPFQPVCRPDCPGLDPVTGERLDERDGAKTEEPADPRWAALTDFAAEPARTPGEHGHESQTSEEREDHGR